LFVSALDSWRIKSARPVMQNTQPTAQPTWVDTHRPSRGNSTISIVWPSASSTSKRAEPSSPGLLGMHPRQSAQFIEQARQLIAYRQPHKVFGAPPLNVERAPLNPRPQHAPLVTGRNAKIAQTLSEPSESHGGVEGSTGVAVGCAAIWPPAAMC